MPGYPVFSLWKVIERFFLLFLSNFNDHVCRLTHTHTQLCRCTSTHKQMATHAAPLHMWLNHISISFQQNSSSPPKHRHGNLWKELALVARLPSALHHFKIYLLASFSFAIKCYSHNCEHDSEIVIFLHPQQSYTTSQLIHTGDISFGEWVHDERDNLLAGGSWPTLDNSSRLNHHTWSASQPSAGTIGVWCIEPPLDQPQPWPGLDSVQVAATYAVISELVPNYASSDVFTAWNKAQFDSQL